MKRLRLFSLLLAIGLLFVFATTAGAAEPALVNIDILTVNDFHGALPAAGRNPGAAAVAAYLQSQRAHNPAGTLILSAGDMFQGTPDSNLLRGKTVIEVMNAVGFDAMALGNHEFDWGLDVLKERQAQAAFPMLAANIVDKATARPVTFVKPYIIIEKQGVKVAVVGLTTPDTAVTTNPRFVGGFQFADPVRTMTALIPELKSQGADIIVVLGHLASYPGTEPAGEATALTAVTGVDVIISGHSHRLVAGKVAGVPVVQADYNGRAVGKISLVYSRQDHRLLASTVTSTKLEPGWPADLRIAAIVAQAQREIAPMKSEVLGRTESGLVHDRYQLSPLGQWVADVMRQASGADIAFMNGGGLRAGLPAGTVTMGDLYTVMPFDNALEVATMTGAQVLAALEHGLGNEKFGRLQYAGLRVTYDAAQPEGRRVVAAQLADGSALDPAAIYQVAVNDFMAVGGDDYTMIKAAKEIVDTFRPLRDVLAEAIRKAGVIRIDSDDRLRPVSVLPSGLIAA
jgi:5'-nucleotidase/UDP-sugar diphosphatase